MNAAELADHVAAKDARITKAQAKALVDGVFSAIRDAAVKGEEVSPAGLRQVQGAGQAGPHRPKPPHWRGG